MASPSRHKRHHSWPPILHLVEIKKEKSLPDIDEDPFAHFITPISEEDDPFDTVFSAGILDAPADDVPKANKFYNKIATSWAKYVARHHVTLHEQYHQEASDDRPYNTVIHEPTRGRPDIRQKRPRTSRTLSGHRHSWREPSVDIFTVMEESEDQVKEAQVDNKLLSVPDGQRMERARL
ncbi:MAG: hypothetical protein M1821_003064 [Bathelium mastoideum]|nr:MAG: hypothetical protein M1821_003064 [Bathelium mastoideum]